MGKGEGDRWTNRESWLGDLVHIAGALASAPIRLALVQRQPRPPLEPSVTGFDVLALLGNRREAVMSSLQLTGRMPRAGFAEKWQWHQDAPLTALTDDFLPSLAADAAATGLKGALSTKGAKHFLRAGTRDIMAFHLVSKAPLDHVRTLAVACATGVKCHARPVVMCGI